MYATVDFAAQERRDALLVPSEALIRTGQRNVVIVAEAGADGKLQFKPVDVEAGDESNGMTEVRAGLAEGVKVVVSGQFLIDSEASLKSVVSRMSDARAPDVHQGEGRVERVGKGELTLSHGPIPSMQWGPMTMDFAAPKSGIPADIKEGARVSFEFRPAADGRFELTAIRRIPEGPK
jgi:Cu(I)/Ag(I) efflux system membrane fusion protein